MTTETKTLVWDHTLDKQITTAITEMVLFSDGTFRKAWVVGVELIGYAYSLDIDGVHEKFLDNYLELNKVQYWLDSQNWSDIDRAVAEAKIQLAALLLARKRGA
jgi:hypothetical protein